MVWSVSFSVSCLEISIEESFDRSGSVGAGLTPDRGADASAHGCSDRSSEGADHHTGGGAGHRATGDGAAGGYRSVAVILLTSCRFAHLISDRHSGSRHACPAAESFADFTQA
ncbi:hypothetical protein [Gordonia paraffinivorans]|uniref:hypothetical protein n=1 Tax=Gordonia paraffinivorans TaxID=175628 RepID=UPI0011B20D83|nr:hypothetical protein [Gordonia paraffinivorans]